MVRFSNPKADTLIDKLRQLNDEINQSGIKTENVGDIQYYHLDQATREIDRSIRNLKVKTTLRLDRLKILLNHLKHSTLRHKFSMDDATYVAELPLLFPEHWAYLTDDSGNWTVKYLDLACSYLSGEQFFFGLTYEQYKHLFYVYNWNEEWGTVKLTGRSGIKMFIKNLEQFIEYFEKGGSNA